MERAEYIKTEERTLVRDLHSKALLSVDHTGLARSRALRAKAQEQESLSTRVAQLETRMDELTTLVSEAVALLRRAHG